jgi:peptidoglycan/LPS O-acetylase OafA/YrhL
MITHDHPGLSSLVDKQTGTDLPIEALRGLAALMVMATHYSYLLTPQTWLWGFASTGVDLFFVLSGYVFAPYVLGKPLSVWPHLIRRFFRLYPLYLLALLLYVALRLPDVTAFDHFWTHLALTHTFTSLAIANFYNPAFWSLPPEVEYYLVLPFLAWLTAGFSYRRLRFIGLVLLAVAMHLALVAAASPGETDITARAIATIHIPGLLAEFMLGSLAYSIVQRDTAGFAARTRFVSGVMVLAGMAAIYANFVAPINGIAPKVPLWIGGNIGLGAAVGYALLVSGVANPPRDVSRQFADPVVTRSRLRLTRTYQPVLMLLGGLSYGVYLFHNAAPQILRRILPEMAGVSAWLACIGITLVMAIAAHLAVEKPMREYGRKLSQTAARSK